MEEEWAIPLPPRSHSKGLSGQVWAVAGLEPLWEEVALRVVVCRTITALLTALPDPGTAQRFPREPHHVPP